MQRGGRGGINVKDLAIDAALVVLASVAAIAFYKRLRASVATNRCDDRPNGTPRGRGRVVDGTGSEEAQQTESQMQSIADATRTHVPLLRDRRAALVERQLACLRRRIRPWPLRPIARAPAKIVFHDKEGCGAAHGGERAAAERAQAAGERHERERRGEGDEGRDEKSGGEKEETNDGTLRSRFWLLGAPIRSRSNQIATRPLAMIPNGLGSLFETIAVVWPRSGCWARIKGHRSGAEAQAERRRFKITRAC